jgi:hypothetical protein
LITAFAGMEKIGAEDMMSTPVEPQGEEELVRIEV